MSNGDSEVKAEKLKTRFESYASYHMTILVKRSIFDEILTRLYSENSWPEGVVVSRFFKNKNGKQ